MIPVEKVIRQAMDDRHTEWLPTRFTEYRVVTETPPQLEDYLPVVKVFRVGGPRRLNLDHPRMSIDVFALSRDDARDVAEAVADWMQFKLAGSSAGGLYFTGVDIGTAPVWIPYTNPNVRRFTASYTVHVKPR